MKIVFAVILTTLLIILPACGIQEPSQETPDIEQNTFATTINPEDEMSTMAEATDAPSTAPTESVQGADYAEDWKAAYHDFLKAWIKDNEEMTYTTAAEYSFVPMQGIIYPVLVLFDGWRQCSFYVYENGKVSAVQGQDGTDLSVLVDMPVYLLNENLYFFGTSGAPAIHVTNEVLAAGNSLVSETIASAIYASSLGDKDYFHGRDDAEITEIEYNTIVNNIKEQGKEVEFSNLKSLKG